MEPRFVRIGSYLVNINAIVYTRRTEDQMKIVLSTDGDDGKPFSIVVSDSDAAKISRVLNSFVLTQEAQDLAQTI
jgi:hypothetical protein